MAGEDATEIVLGAPRRPPVPPPWRRPLPLRRHRRQDCYARDEGEQDPWSRWERALESVAAFAQRHGKRVAVSEWGSSLDDPDLVRSFLRWARDRSIAYHIYWNVPPAPNEERDTRLAGQPQAAEAHREDGG